MGSLALGFQRRHATGATPVSSHISVLYVMFCTLVYQWSVHLLYIQGHKDCLPASQKYGGLLIGFTLGVVHMWAAQQPMIGFTLGVSGLWAAMQPLHQGHNLCMNMLSI